ncbi:unnamed protein product, partial [Polarella glacialis]
YDFRDASQDISSQVLPDQPEAAGIVGFTPLLQPGAGFEFGSGASLTTPTGSATGRFLVMVEPELSGEDAELHERMEQSDLMMRFAYFRSLGTEQFYLPLSELRFNADVPCVSLRRGS